MQELWARQRHLSMHKVHEKVQWGHERVLAVNCSSTNPLHRAPDRRGSGVYDILERRRKEAEKGLFHVYPDLTDDDLSDTDDDDFASCQEEEEDAVDAADVAAAVAEDAAFQADNRAMDVAAQPILGRRYGPGARTRSTDPISRPTTLPLHPVWPTRGPPTSERTGRLSQPIGWDGTPNLTEAQTSAFKKLRKRSKPTSRRRP